MRKIGFTIPGSLLLLVLVLWSCKKTETVVSYDVTDATIKSFYLAANDSFPGFAAASFKVEHRSDTGLIAPLDGDSLLFGTPLTAVVPRISYNSRPSAALYYMGDTVFTYSGYDTLDLTRQPVYLRVFAANRKDNKFYRIIAYAHQADPDQYIVTRLADAIAQPCALQVLYTGSDFAAFLSDGQSLRLVRSADGISWSMPQTLTGLPDNCAFRQFVYDSISASFCYAVDTMLYRSADGVTWTSQRVEAQYGTVVATLMDFQSRVWLLTDNRDTLHLTTWQPADGLLQTVAKVPPSFPVSDFAATSFLSTGGRQHALIYGGYDRQGNMLGSAWSIEAADNEFRVMDVASANAQPTVGAAVVAYNHRLLRLGGLQQDGNTLTVDQSLSEGMQWQPVDSTRLPVPDRYFPRYRVSALVVNNNIYLFGGQNHTQTFTDAYRSRLNSIEW